MGVPAQTWTTPTHQEQQQQEHHPHARRHHCAHALHACDVDAVQTTTHQPQAPRQRVLTLQWPQELQWTNWECYSDLLPVLYSALQVLCWKRMQRLCWMRLCWMHLEHREEGAQH